MNVFLSFSVTAGAFPVFFGVASVLREVISKHPELKFHFGGVSGGALVATSLAIDLPDNEVIYGRDLFASYFDRWYKLPFFNFYKFANKLLEHYLEEDSHKIVSDRLFLGVTEVTLKGLQNLVISQFESSQEVIQAILASAHLPFHGHGPAKRFKGKWVLDGGITNKVLLKDHMTNIIFRIEEHDLELKDYWLSPCPLKWDRLYQIGQEYGEQKTPELIKALNLAYKENNSSNISITKASDPLFRKTLLNT